MLILATSIFVAVSLAISFGGTKNLKPSVSQVCSGHFAGRSVKTQDEVMMVTGTYKKDITAAKQVSYEYTTMLGRMGACFESFRQGGINGKQLIIFGSPSERDNYSRYVASILIQSKLFLDVRYGRQ